jgi:hypothetical protein
VILEDEADVSVAECRLLALGQLKRIGAVEGDGARGRRLQRTENIQERTLAAP